MVDGGREAQDVSPRRFTKSRRVVISCVVAAALVIGIMVGSVTHWFGLQSTDGHGESAEASCEDSIRHDLVAPATARFPRNDQRKDILTEDDHVRLGFDASRATSSRRRSPKALPRLNSPAGPPSSTMGRSGRR
jgi:hypothetical protein